VGWAKAQSAVPHHSFSIRSINGGHASLCPPYKADHPPWFAQRAITLMESSSGYCRVALTVATDVPELVGLLPVA
jgi:hypothetical protein